MLLLSKSWWTYLCRYLLNWWWTYHGMHIGWLHKERWNWLLLGITTLIGCILRETWWTLLLTLLTFQYLLKVPTIPLLFISWKASNKLRGCKCGLWKVGDCYQLLHILAFLKVENILTFLRFLRIFKAQPALSSNTGRSPALFCCPFKIGRSPGAFKSCPLLLNSAAGLPN